MEFQPREHSVEGQPPQQIDQRNDNVCVAGLCIENLSTIRRDEGQLTNTRQKQRAAPFISSACRCYLALLFPDTPLTFKIQRARAQNTLDFFMGLKARLGSSEVLRQNLKVGPVCDCAC